MDQFDINSGYVADLLDRYLHNPESVDENWRSYFRSRLSGPPDAQTNGEGTTNGQAITPAIRTKTEPLIPTAMSMAEVQGRVSQLINAYRARGHLFARVDPLRLETAATP